MNGQGSEQLLQPATDAEEAFVRNATNVFNEAWKGRPKQLEPEVEAVVGALTTRQIALVNQLAEAPSTWTASSAPLFLQAMAQVHITLNWVVKDPEVNARRFIAHGLSQEQSHLNRQWLRQSELGDGSPAGLSEIGGWIDGQRTIFPGAAEAIDAGWPATHEMADQAGCLEFYELFYHPFEGNTRSTWQHLGRFHLKLCGNPEHPFHVVPAAEEEPEPHYLRLAARCLKVTQALLAEFFLTFDGPGPAVCQYHRDTHLDHLRPDLQRIQAIDSSSRSDPPGPAQPSETGGVELPALPTPVPLT